MSSAETAVQDPAEADELRQGMVEQYRTALGDQLVGSHVVPGDNVWLRVAPPAWREAGLIARDRLRCNYFCFLSAIDWMASPYGRSEDGSVDPTASADPVSDIATGVAGGDTRFQVFARLESPATRSGLFLKVDVAEDDFAVDSWVSLYAGANWHERETHEMFGIGFRGHPHLVNIYLPGGFEGHPLRKDFPLLARQVKPWPGIVDVEPMPGDATDGDATDAGAGEAAS